MKFKLIYLLTLVVIFSCKKDEINNPEVVLDKTSRYILETEVYKYEWHEAWTCSPGDDTTIHPGDGVENADYFIDTIIILDTINVEFYEDEYIIVDGLLDSVIDGDYNILFFKNAINNELEISKIKRGVSPDPSYPLNSYLYDNSIEFNFGFADFYTSTLYEYYGEAEELKK